MYVVDEVDSFDHSVIDIINSCRNSGKIFSVFENLKGRDHQDFGKLNIDYLIVGDTSDDKLINIINPKFVLRQSSMCVDCLLFN